MNDYTQPSFYHFSQDSLELVKFVLQRHQPCPNRKILDAFSGCGIVGIELSRQLDCEVDFLEINEKFIPYLEENTIGIKRDQLIVADFLAYDSEYCYDILVANPPFYNTQSNRLGVSTNRNRCKFIEQKSFSQIFYKAKDLLKPSGVAYILYSNKNGCIPPQDISYQKLHRDLFVAIIYGAEKITGGDVDILLKQ